ncbi:MAG: hypothetical protein ABW162_13460 [Candidatus Sedimenticola sp. PURPLELP]
MVVQSEFFDAPMGARDWWLVPEEGEIDLCLEDPGCEIDVLIKSSLAAITAVWTCQESFNSAMKKGDIKALGDPGLTGKLQDWLRSSLLSRLGTLDKLPGLNWNVQ